MWQHQLGNLLPLSFVNKPQTNINLNSFVPSDPNNSVFPDILQQAILPIVSQSICNRPDWYNNTITANMLCAGYAQGGKDSCDVSIIMFNLYYLPCPQKSVLKQDRFLPVRSQFDTIDRVNFSTPTYCQSATFGPLAFCVCPLFFTTKNQKRISHRHSCDF